MLGNGPQAQAALTTIHGLLKCFTLELELHRVLTKGLPLRIDVSTWLQTSKRARKSFLTLDFSEEITHENGPRLNGSRSRETMLIVTSKLRRQRVTKTKNWLPHCVNESRSTSQTKLKGNITGDRYVHEITLIKAVACWHGKMAQQLEEGQLAGNGQRVNARVNIENEQKSPSK